MKTALFALLLAGLSMSTFGQVVIVQPPVVVEPCVYPEYGDAYIFDPVYNTYYFVCDGVRLYMPLSWDWRVHGFYQGPYYGTGRGRYNGERYGGGRYNYDSRAREGRENGRVREGR